MTLKNSGWIIILCVLGTIAAPNGFGIIFLGVLVSLFTYLSFQHFKINQEHSGNQVEFVGHTPDIPKQKIVAFCEFLEQQLRSGRITKQIKREIAERGSSLGIDGGLIKSIRRERMLKDVDVIIEDIVTTQRFTDEHQKKLEKISKQHGFSKPYTDEHLERMRLQHNLETKPNYQPEAVDVSDPLDADEECYLVIPGHWLRSHDSSAEGKLKASLEQFVKDPVVFASNTSENNYDFENSDNAAIHLSGRLLFTNERICVRGESESDYLPFSDIAYFEFYNDAIRLISNHQDRFVLLIDSEDATLVAALLLRLWRGRS